MSQVLAILLCVVASSSAILPIVIPPPVVPIVVGAQKGITLTFDGKFIRLGLLTLPLDFLCTSTEITKILACQICDKDCKSVHNTYGGQCAVRSDTGETICECQDDPPANCTVSTSEQRCGQLYGRDLPLGALLGTGIGLAEQVFVDARPTLQCSTDPVTGCQVDCKTNHQYNCGECVLDTPVPQTCTPDANCTTQKLFCECSYTPCSNSTV